MTNIFTACEYSSHQKCSHVFTLQGDTFTCGCACHNPKPVFVGRRTKFAEGEAYWKTYNDARVILNSVQAEFPQARIVEYGRGYAVQTVPSGSYLGKNLRPTMEVASA